MGIVDIKIYLNPNENGRRIYEPQQKLTGSAELFLNVPKPIRGFYVLFTGISRCGWTETKESETVHYSGKTTHLQRKIYFFGSATANALNFKPGNYKYDFECFLPADLPSSFSGTFGKIEYKVQAFLDVGWMDRWTWAGEVFEVFTVQRHDNLNDYPSVKKPQKASKVEDFFNLLRFTKGKCYLTALIPFCGYIPGSSISIKICYNNESNVEIETTKISLISQVTFASTEPEAKAKIIKQIMAEKEAEGVAEKSRKEFEFNFELPRALLNSNSKLSKTVFVSYSLVIEAVVNSWHVNPNVEIPIVIGSVAIGDTENAIRHATNSVQGNSERPQQRPTAPAYDDLVNNDLPPSFEEAMNSKRPDEVGWKFN